MSDHLLPEDVQAIRSVTDDGLLCLATQGRLRREVWLKRADDAEGQARLAHGLLRQAEDERRRRQRQLGLLRRGCYASAAVVVAIIAAFPLINWLAWQADQGRRQEAAQALVALSHDLLNREEQHRGQLIAAHARAVQSLGLAPQLPAAQQQALASSLALTTWAIAEGAPGSAEQHLQQAVHYGLSETQAAALEADIAALYAELAAQPERRRQAWRQQAEQWLSNAEDLSREQRETISARWASWQPDNDEDVLALRSIMQDALNHRQLAAQRLAAEAMHIAHRSRGSHSHQGTLYPLEWLIVPALASDEHLRSVAIQTLAIHQPEHLYEALIHGLIALRVAGHRVRHQELQSWILRRERSDDGASESALALRQTRLSLAGYDDQELRITRAVSDVGRWSAQMSRARFHSDWRSVENYARQIIEYSDAQTPRRQSSSRFLAATYLGRALRAQNRYEESLAQARADWEWQNTYPGFAINLAAAALAAGNRELANTAADDALDLIRRRHRLRSNSYNEVFPSVLNRLERHQDAITFLTSQGEPGDDMWEHFNLIGTLRDAGEWESALSRSYAATNRWPGFHFAYGQRSQLYLQRHMLDEAMEAATTAISIMPRNPGILSYHAAALSALGEHEHAAARYLMGNALRNNVTWVLHEGMRSARRARADRTSVDLITRLTTDKESSVRQDAMLSGLDIALEYNALPLALDMIEHLLAEQHYSLTRMAMARLEAALPGLRSSPLTMFTATSATYWTVSELETLLQCDDHAWAERSEDWQLLEQRAQQLIALIDSPEARAEQRARLDILAAFSDNDAEAALIRLRQHEAEGELSALNRLRFHLALHQREDWQLRPLRMDPRQLGRHPLPAAGVAVDTPSRERLIALITAMSEWPEDERKNLFIHASAEDCMSAIEVRGTPNPERDLKALVADTPRIDRGWDFPPQVWHERQERRRQAEAAAKETAENDD